MSAREVIAKQVRWGEINPVSLSVADEIITMLNLSGHIIMKKEDVAAIRDKALEEAAKEADKYCADENGETSLHPALAWSDEQKEWWQCGQLDGAIAISSAIRSLKSEARG